MCNHGVLPRTIHGSDGGATFVEDCDVKLVLSRKPDAKPKKAIRSYRATALTSAFSKWYASCKILCLEQERKPENWKTLHVGGLKGISCQHLQVIATNLPGCRRLCQDDAVHRIHTNLYCRRENCVPRVLRPSADARV